MGETKETNNVALGLYFAFWYLGNSFYNIQNKRALNATGGKHAGFGMTVATLQLGVGALYSFVIWIVGYNFLPCCGFVAPTKQKPPTMKASDFIKMFPVAFCSAAAHSASVLALNAGSVTFGQIVKAGEPVFSALVRQAAVARATAPRGCGSACRTRRHCRCGHATCYMAFNERPASNRTLRRKHAHPAR